MVHEQWNVVDITEDLTIQLVNQTTSWLSQTVLALNLKVRHKLQKLRKKLRKKENQICPKQKSVWLP